MVESIGMLLSSVSLIIAWKAIVVSKIQENLTNLQFFLLMSKGAYM